MNSWPSAMILKDYLLLFWTYGVKTRQALAVPLGMDGWMEA